MRQWLMREWLMIVLLVLTVMQTIVMWTHAKKTGKKVRPVVLPFILLSVANAMILARESLNAIPDQIDRGLRIILMILLLLAFWKMAALLKRQSQNVVLIENKNNR